MKGFLKHLNFSVYLYDVTIITLFLLSIFVSHFPPYASLKLYNQIFPLLFWIMILSNLQYRDKLKSFFSSDRILQYLIILFLFILYCAISLFYSFNSLYGTGKIIGLIFGVFPAIFALTILLRNITEQQLNILKYIFLFSGILLTILLFSATTMSYDGNERILLWTHVGVGRFLGFSFLISMYHYSQKRSLQAFLIATFITCGIVLCGLRATILFALPLYCIFAYFAVKNSRRKFKTVQFVPLILVAMFGLLYYAYISFPKFQSRIKSSLSFTIATDDSVQARYMGLKNAIAMILDKPLFGWGMGGFDIKYHEFDQSLFLHYPHNILFEISVELGIIGLLLFLIAIIITFNHIHMTNKYLTLFFLFALWSSFFSGDILYQTPLLIGIAFIFLSQEEKKYINSLISF